MNIPMPPVVQPRGLMEYANEASNFKNSQQQNQLNNLKLQYAPQQMEMQQKAAQQGLQQDEQAMNVQKQAALQGLATDFKARLQSAKISDPDQAQQYLDQYVQSRAPYIKSMGFPMTDRFTVDQVMQLAGPTAQEQQQAELQNKLAEQYALAPGRIAEEQAKAGIGIAKEGRDFERAKALKQFENELPKAPSEFQQYQIGQKQEQKAQDQMDAIANINDTIDEFKNLKEIQKRTTTGPVAGSPLMVGVRKAIPGNLAGGEDLQRLEKGYNTMAVKAIGAFKAGGVTFGQLSNAEGQWIKSTQASLDAGGDINQEQLDKGLKLLENRKARIEKSPGAPQPTKAPSFTSPEEVKAAIRSGVIDMNTAGNILRTQFGME